MKVRQGPDKLSETLSPRLSPSRRRHSRVSIPPPPTAFSRKSKPLNLNHFPISPFPPKFHFTFFKNIFTHSKPTYASLPLDK